MSGKTRGLRPIASTTRPRRIQRGVTAPRVPAPPRPGRLTPGAERAMTAPSRGRPTDILALQRLVGNRGVSNLIQGKLTVGPAGDRYEQEADRVAKQVMTKPVPMADQPSAVSRQPSEEEELQAKRTRDGSFTAGVDLEQRLAAQKGGGTPLPHETRIFMEPRFGSDFSGVRVHTGGEAADLNRSIQAQAFTHGQDVYFGAGRYDPDTDAGKRLLAHELTHVVQQNGAKSIRPKRDEYGSLASPEPVQERISPARRIQHSRIQREGGDGEEKEEEKTKGKRAQPRVFNLQNLEGLQQLQQQLKPQETEDRPEKTPAPTLGASPFPEILDLVNLHLLSKQHQKMVAWKRTRLNFERGKESAKGCEKIDEGLDTFHSMPQGDQEQAEKKKNQGYVVQYLIQQWHKSNKPSKIKIFTRKKLTRAALIKLNELLTKDCERLGMLVDAHRLRSVAQQAVDLDKSPPQTVNETGDTVSALKRLLDNWHIWPKEPEILVARLKQQVQERIAQLEEWKPYLEKVVEERKATKKKAFTEWLDKEKQQRDLVAKPGEKSLVEPGMLEAIDPHHREGSQLAKLYQRWLTDQTKLKFYAWITQWEGQNKELPRIRYVKEDEQKRYKLGFKGTQPFYPEREDKKELKKKGGGRVERVIYVMTPDQRFYGRWEDKKRQLTFHHSSFVAGLSVGAAGTMDAGSDKLAIDLESGHYQPKTLHMLNAVQGLKHAGVSLSQVDVRPFEKNLFASFLPAEHFLESLKLLKETEGKEAGDLTKVLAIPKAKAQLTEAYQAYQGT